MERVGQLGIQKGENGGEIEVAHGGIGHGWGE